MGWQDKSTIFALISKRESDRIVRDTPARNTEELHEALKKSTRAFHKWPRNRHETPTKAKIRPYPENSTMMTSEVTRHLSQRLLILLGLLPQLSDATFSLWCIEPTIISGLRRHAESSSLDMDPAEPTNSEDLEIAEIFDNCGDTQVALIATTPPESPQDFLAFPITSWILIWSGKSGRGLSNPPTSWQKLRKRINIWKIRKSGRS